MDKGSETRQVAGLAGYDVDAIPAELERIPDGYDVPAEHPGTLERLDYGTYDSFNYGVAVHELQKTAWVYVPYGYDADERYDVLYLSHGGWSDETTQLGTPGNPSALKNALDHSIEDLARAIAYLYEHADELGILMDGYSLWGGSAGARMSAWLGAYGTESFGERVCPHPAACIVNYTGLSEVTGAEPPTYSAVGTADWIADWRTMQRRIERIQACGTDAQIEVFDGLGHGFGLGTGTVAEGWLDRAVQFWERQL